MKLGLRRRKQFNSHPLFENWYVVAILVPNDNYIGFYPYILFLENPSQLNRKRCTAVFRRKKLNIWRMH